MEKDKAGFISIFLIFCRISAFTLGGGAVMLGLMEEEFVKRREWLTKDEMIDIFAMVNSMPGIIGVNSAVIIGKKIAGFGGAVGAALGVLLPSFIIILALSEIILPIRNLDVTTYAFRAVRAAAAALILVILLRLFRNRIQSWKEWFIAVSAFIELRIIGVPALWVVLISACLGLILYGREK